MPAASSSPVDPVFCHLFAAADGLDGDRATVLSVLAAVADPRARRGVYSQGESEQIVGKALMGHRDAGVLARKIHDPMPHVSGPSLSCSSSRRLAVLIALASSLVGYQRRCI
jgi:hypothetical protein